MTLNDRDIRILSHIANYRYGFSQQIYRLFFPGQSLQNMHRILKRIQTAKLIERLRIPRNNAYKLGDLIYLTKQAQGLLESLYPSKTVWVYKDRKPRTIRFLYHTYRSIDCRIAFEQGIERHSLMLKQIKWEMNRTKIQGKFRGETTLCDKHGNTLLVPDLGYTVQSKKTGNDQSFLIEVDCGTETLAGALAYNNPRSVMAKFERYEEILLNSKQSWKQTLSSQASSFRVLFVTESDKRIKNLLKRMKQHLKHPQFFLLSTFDRIIEHGAWGKRVWKKVGSQGQYLSLFD